MTVLIKKEKIKKIVNFLGQRYKQELSVLESISEPNVRISNFLYEFTGIYDWKRPSIIYFWSKSAIGISSFRLPIYSIKRQNCNSIPAIDICRHVRFHRRWYMDLRASILVINIPINWAQKKASRGYNFKCSDSEKVTLSWFLSPFNDWLTYVRGISV